MIGRKYYNTLIIIDCWNKNIFRLAETLQVYLEEYSQQELPSSIVDRFPASITVGQAVTTWKEIVKYQHRYETEITLN